MKEIILLACVVVVSFASSVSHVEVAGSTQSLHKWTKTDIKPLSNELITLGFAIKQRNLQKLKDIFFSVSDPHSLEFGRHLTTEEVASLVGAEHGTLQEIQQWLKDNKAQSVTLSQTLDYVWASFGLQDVETLLSIKLSVYSHQSPNSRKVALITRSEDAPVVPAHLASFIDFISGVWHFPETEGIAPHLMDAKSFYKRSPLIDSFEPTWMLFAVPKGVVVYFAPMCAGGKNISNDGYHPCSDYGNPITSFNFTYAQYDYNKGEMVFTSAITTTSSGNWPTCTVDIQFVCELSISGLEDDSYVEANSTFQYCFADGTCTAVGVFPVPVVPSAYLGPQDVRKYYGVPAGLVAGSPNSSQAVAEFGRRFYSPSDLDQFSQMFQLPPSNVSVVGTNYPLAPQICSSLDIQLITGVGQGVNTWFWYNPGHDWIAEWAQSVLNTPGG